MVYEIILSKKAEKFIDKLPTTIRERVIIALERLRIRPYSYVSRLVGVNLYKFRIRDYRCILDIKDESVCILVLEIGHRKNVYK